MKMESDTCAGDCLPVTGAPLPGKGAGSSSTRPAHKWMPVINDYCVGCSNCVDICPVSALGIIWDAAVLSHPDRCTSCGLCIDPCGDDAIHMQWMASNGDRATGQWRDSAEGGNNGSKAEKTGILSWLRNRLVRR